VAEIRRAAASVPSNIAEGFRRRGRGEKARFFNIAEASLVELDPGRQNPKSDFRASRRQCKLISNRRFLAALPRRGGRGGTKGVT
jgi:hypothetical protein